MNSKRILTVLVTCVLGLSLIAAAPSSASAPEALQNDKSVSGVLAGNAGGAFAFYTVNYPGDSSVATIELQYAPADPVTNAGLGFNVYGSDGSLIGRGHPVQDTGGYGVLKLEYASSTEATWLVQVYNYIPDVNISYSIVTQGLPKAKAEAEAKVTEVPANASTETLAQPQTSTTKTDESGSLAGNHAGAFASYQVTVASDATDVEVTMLWSPDDPVAARGVGFVAYGPTGEVIRSSGTGTPGEQVATLPADIPGAYQIQIYNYIDGLIMQYTLSSAPITD